MRNLRMILILMAVLVQIYGAISQNESLLREGLEYEVDLSFGNVNHFSIGQAAFMSVDRVTAEKIIIVYRDWDNDGFGTAVLGSVDNLEVTYDELTIFASSSIYLPKVKMINDSVFLVVYRDMSNAGKGAIIKGNIHDNDVQFGSPIDFTSSMISTSSLIVMNDSTFIVAYKDNSNGFGNLLSGKILNENIVLGQSQVFNSATSFENVLCRLSDTSFVITYRDNGNGEMGTARAGIIQNEEITLNEPAVFASSPTTEIALTELNTSDFIVSFSSSGEIGSSIIGTLTGNSLTFSDSYVYCENSISGNSVIAISDSIVIISFANEGNNNFGTSVLANINNDVISYQDTVVYNNSGSFTSNASIISDTTFVLVFRNEGNDFSGSSVCGKITTGQITSVDFVNNTADIKVYPNPTGGAIIVEGAGISKIEILNMNGQCLKIIQPCENTMLIDLGGFKRGVYIVKATLDHNVTFKKIVLE